MMSHENLSELERLNYTYVIAAKLRSMSDEMQERILCGDNYKLQSFGDHPGWIGEFDYKNRRLIVSYKADRARRDEHQRGQVVEKIKKRLGTDGSTQKLITNQGVKKFTESDKSKTTVSQEKR
jgi:hypothetical protein